MEAMKIVFIVLCCLFVCTSTTTTPSKADLATQCSDALQKLVQCLDFASGKAPVPPKECCNSVTVIKGSSPQCLCFIIAQAHNGSEQLKSLGLQEDKLLQLPATCKLTNASVAECPKLLGIPANSPAAAIFTSNSTKAPTTAPGNLTPNPPNSDSSYGSKLEHSISLLATIFFFVHSISSSRHY